MSSVAPKDHPRELEEALREKLAFASQIPVIQWGDVLIAEWVLYDDENTDDCLVKSIFSPGLFRPETIIINNW